MRAKGGAMADVTSVLDEAGVDFHKAASLVGAPHKKLHMASEDDLKRDYPEFALGAVPPFGGAHRDQVIVDSRLAERDSVVLEAGSHERVALGESRVDDHLIAVRAAEG